MINVTRTDLPNLERYIQYLREIWSSNWVTNDGDLVRLLESRLAEYLGTGPVAAVSTGTAALQLALRALGIDGEVITTPFTFVATTNSIIWEGLTPVFADIDPETFCLDPGSVAKKISRRTGAILAVHIFGNPCNVRELESLATSRGVALIFDAAHAFGVQVSGRPVIDFGDASCLSFHATKVFSTIEGGAVRASDEQVMDRVRTMRNHGIVSEEDVLLAGTNSKMNEFEAAMGLCNLEGIDERIEARKRLSDEYKLKLGEVRGDRKSVV
jgi:dTDP-4-amino-4,6-dideoxygalactose transaminase